MYMVIALQAIGAVATVLGILTITSLINVIWLRLAARALRFGNIPFLTAFKCTFLSAFIAVTFYFVVGAHQKILIATDEYFFPPQQSQTTAFSPPRHVLARPSMSLTGPQSPYSESSAASPMYSLIAVLFGLFITSAVFYNGIAVQGSDTRMTFGDSVTLASLYIALAFASLVVLAIVSFCFVMGIMTIIGK